MKIGEQGIQILSLLLSVQGDLLGYCISSNVHNVESKGAFAIVVVSSCDMGLSLVYSLQVYAKPDIKLPKLTNQLAQLIGAECV